ncbi:hypothetical protein GMSM_40690 [Geomonas sp. Red276]
MRTLILAVLALVLAAGTITPCHATPAAPPQAYKQLPKPGTRIPLDANHVFTYGFAAAPKIGTSIMRVEIFTLDGKRDTSFTVKGDADMPSMRGAHASGDQPFVLSNKGVYLLPIRLPMPGDWEIRLTFGKNGKTVLRGAYLFDL